METLAKFLFACALIMVSAFFRKTAENLLEEIQNETKPNVQTDGTFRYIVLNASPTHIMIL